jgi:hypothetical protein
MNRPTTVERMDKRSGNAVRTLGTKSDAKSEKGKEVGLPLDV